jgi:hypothetical protein
LDIPEMPELEAAQRMVELQQTVPHTGTSAGMLLGILLICVADFVNFNVVDASAGSADGSNTAFHQMTQGLSLTEVVDVDESQIIDCLEHVSYCCYCFKLALLLSWFLI